MINFIKNELYGWKLWEVLWLLISCSVITLVSVALGDSLMGIISAVSGILYVILAGKGKLSAYIFGLVNSILYAIISYKANLFGETMLNGIYYVPMQFVGFFLWSRNMNSDTGEVRKRHMSYKNRILCLLSIALGTYLYGVSLSYLGDAMPYTDSFTTVASVIAMIVSVKMYSEQWWIWLSVNSLSIYMWYRDFIGGSDNIATLLMWVVYLISGVLMLIKWERELKNESNT